MGWKYLGGYIGYGREQGTGKGVSGNIGSILDHWIRRLGKKVGTEPWVGELMSELGLTCQQHTERLHRDHLYTPLKERITAQNRTTGAPHTYQTGASSAS